MLRHDHSKSSLRTPIAIPPYGGFFGILIFSMNDRDELLTTILSLHDLEEAQAFFRDLLTEKEIEDFSKRWKAAKLLSNGVSYSKIQTQTGLSSRTVARISKWVQEGVGGFSLLLRRMNKDE